MNRAARRTRSALVVAALVVASTFLTISGCSAGGAAPPSLPQPSSPATSSGSVTPAPRPRTQAATQAPPAVPTVGTDPRTQSVESTPAPVKLSVRGRDIDMPVVPVGVADTGDMALPASNRDVGWYEFGGRPADDAGVTVMAAHVDTVAEGLGPFARLKGVRKGTEITVTTADGTVHRYRVSAVDEIAKSSVPLADVFQRSGPARLVLITCGGAYDQGVGYTDNVLVTAVPES